MEYIKSRLIWVGAELEGDLRDQIEVGAIPGSAPNHFLTFILLA
jgi:hypothetical protein